MAIPGERYFVARDLPESEAEENLATARSIACFESFLPTGWLEFSLASRWHFLFRMKNDREPDR